MEQAEKRLLTIVGAILAVAAITMLIFGGGAVGMATNSRNNCADSDGGIAITVYGWISGMVGRERYTYTDTCMSSTTVLERFCNMTSPSSVQRSCQTFTTNACQGGKCVDTSSCMDTDGGIVPSVMGNVSGNKLGVPFALGDTCQGTTLVEYYCSGTGWQSVTLSCLTNTTNACVNGACVYQPPQQSSCFDSDGYNPFIAGFVNGTTNGVPFFYADTCLGSAYVAEWYCSGTTPRSGNVSCAMNGTMCVSGRCQ